MSLPNLEIVTENAGLYAVTGEAGDILDAIGLMNDYDTIMEATVEKWPNLDHLDLPKS